MESSRGILWGLITSVIIHIVQAQDQLGFISLDCGLPANEPTPYMETTTGLEFSSDSTYIQNGKNGRIESKREDDFLKPSTTLRYFPDGIRNCYNLPVEKGIKHLIRGRFVYGNYDGRDIAPKFDVYVGPNLWVTIDLENRINGTREEILHVPTSNSLQICLVKTGETTPMISALEVRPMGNDSYITQSGSLELSFRYYISRSNKYIRYPDDVYDRQWAPHFQETWTEISNNSDVENSNDYVPPKAVLNTVAIPTNASEPLTIEWTSSDNPDDQYYFYLHFAEIQDLRANDTREFNILLNGKTMLNDPVTPRRLKTTTVYSISPRTCEGGECKLELTRTNRSTLPPLLNAYEIYRVVHFPQSETDEIDVVAIKGIKDAYELKRINWQGDPCVPQDFMWDGLSCSNINISTPPRITSLNLSSTGLNGTIAAALQNLTQLEKLDLSNNNLTGEIPEFLGNMESLFVINLSGNNLNGSIPQVLQNNKGLALFVDGNPRLCLSDPCRNSSKNKALIPIVASAASAGVVIVVLVLFLVLRKKKSTTKEGLRQLPRTPEMNATSAN